MDPHPPLDLRGVQRCCIAMRRGVAALVLLLPGARQCKWRARVLHVRGSRGSRGALLKAQKAFCYSKHRKRVRVVFLGRDARYTDVVVEMLFVHTYS